jgi:octaprenyl-diphosphate synthase
MGTILSDPAKDAIRGGAYFHCFRNVWPQLARSPPAPYFEDVNSTSSSSTNPVAGQAFAFTHLAASIAAELVEVDALFSEELSSDIPAVSRLIKHVSRFRGKMLRPTLLLLTARAFGQPTRAHIVLATVVEMVHMATLVHDDVLDEAELRRKGPTVNHLRGNEAAVMLGDLLISHSFHLCSSLDSQRASRLIGATTNTVCEGELLQIDQRNNLELGEETYFAIIEKKTAALVSACCRLGAEFAGGSAEQVEAMSTYGQCVGTAFQIQDDVLDLAGEAGDVGKTLGIDVEKCKLTLPLIHFLKTAPKEHGELLRSLLRSDDPDRGDKIRNLVLPSGSLDFARKTARGLIEKAQECLKLLPESVARRALHEAAEFVVARAV